MAATPRRHPVEEEESYFISMTDLMVGLLFIFIIMLMVFALQYREAERQSQTAEQAQQSATLRLEIAKREQQLTTQRLVNADQVRDDILDSLQRFLRDHGITVEIVKDQGVLRLPEEILFDKARTEINRKGQSAIGVLGQALALVLPCYTAGRQSLPADKCSGQHATIDSIFVEGHTDIDPLVPRAGLRDNIDLSAIRATNTYRTLLQMQPDLLYFENTRGFPVLSVSGYGPYRPAVADQSTEDNKAKNRRIDLRILMTTPRAEDAARFEHEVHQEMQRK